MRKTKTISIPPMLEAEMAKFEENWSAVACRAFEIRIQELKSMQTENGTERAVARLRASKMKATQALYSSGESAGSRFVEDHAEYLQLERLEQWRDAIGGSFAEVLDSNMVYTVAKVMTNNDEDGSASDILDTLKSLYGDDINQPEWIEGFLDGAMAKYDEVKEHI